MKPRPDIGLTLRPTLIHLVVGLAVAIGPRFSSCAAAPAGFILDEARVISEKSQAQLSEEMRRFRDVTGCGLWLVTTTFLNGKSVRDHSNALADAWTRSGRGVVLVYDRASDSHSVSPSVAMWQTYPTPVLVEAFRETGTVIQDKKAPLEKRLQNAARLLMTRITGAEQERVRHNQLLQGQELWAALAFLALLAAGAFAWAVVMAAVRRRDATNAIRYFFPQAECATRFGAPYGGGVIAEIQVNLPPR